MCWPTHPKQQHPHHGHPPCLIPTSTIGCGELCSSPGKRAARYSSYSSSCRYLAASKRLAMLEWHCHHRSTARPSSSRPTGVMAQQEAGAQEAAGMVSGPQYLGPKASAACWCIAKAGDRACSTTRIAGGWATPKPPGQIQKNGRRQPVSLRSTRGGWSQPQAHKHRQPQRSAQPKPAVCITAMLPHS